MEEVRGFVKAVTKTGITDEQREHIKVLSPARDVSAEDLKKIEKDIYDVKEAKKTISDTEFLAYFRSIQAQYPPGSRNSSTTKNMPMPISFTEKKPLSFSLPEVISKSRFEKKPRTCHSSKNYNRR